MTPADRLVDRPSARILRFLTGELGPYIRAKDKKRLLTQIREMLALQREYRAVPYYYVTHGLYRRSHAGHVLDYLPVDRMIEFCVGLNPREGVAAASDKLAFSNRMRAAGLSALQHLALLRNGEIRDPEDRLVTFPQLVELLRKQCREVFIKLRQCGQGIGALKLSVSELESMGWGRLHQRLWSPTVTPWSEYLVQRVIVQHPILSSMAAASVNTVRIDTYLDGDTVHFNTAVLRVGNGVACTDNWASGGLIVDVDLSSGILRGHGKSKSKFGKREFGAHPVTQARFDGVALPYWQELKLLVQSAARAMVPLRSLGWDVALTPDGPLIVEVNHDYDLFLSQYASGGYRRTPFGQALLKRLESPETVHQQAK